MPRLLEERRVKDSVNQSLFWDVLFYEMSPRQSEYVFDLHNDLRRAADEQGSVLFLQTHVAAVDRLRRVRRLGWPGRDSDHEPLFEVHVVPIPPPTVLPRVLEIIYLHETTYN